MKTLSTPPPTKDSIRLSQLAPGDRFTFPHGPPSLYTYLGAEDHGLGLVILKARCHSQDSIKLFSGGYGANDVTTHFKEDCWVEFVHPFNCTTAFGVFCIRKEDEPK